MSGGKSSSSSSQSQSTTQLDVSGLVTGDNLQGTDVNQAQTILRGQSIRVDHIDAIPDEVGAAFQALVGTVNNSIEAVKSVTAAGQKIISDTTASAITSVSERSEGADNPELSAITKLVPVAIVAAVTIIIVKVLK